LGASDLKTLDEQEAVVKKDKRKTKVLKAAFKEGDEDFSGEIDIDEFMHSFRENEDFIEKVATAAECAVEDLKGMSDEDIAEVFRVLDIDHSGTIDLEEFVDGITQIVASDEPMENIRSRKQMQCARMQLTKIEEELPEMEKRIMESIEKMMDEKLAKIIESLAASNAKSPGRRPPSRDRDDTSPRLSPNGRSPKSGRSPGRSRKENFADTWAPKVELSYY